MDARILAPVCRTQGSPTPPRTKRAAGAPAAPGSARTARPAGVEAPDPVLLQEQGGDEADRTGADDEDLRVGVRKHRACSPCALR